MFLKSSLHLKPFVQKEQNINKGLIMRTELKNILSGNEIGFVKDAIGCVSLVLILFAGLHLPSFY